MEHFVGKQKHNVQKPKGPTISLLGGGGGVILKKNFLEALVRRKKLHAAQMN